MEQICVKNEMMLEFDAISNNESFARVAVAAFIAPLNPTLEEMNDIKTAVSEAVTNSIIHGYENFYGYSSCHGYGKDGDNIPSYVVIHPGKIVIRCSLSEDILQIEVEDHGQGIEDIDRAMEPLFTTKPQLERSGMGFAFMEAFMDDLEVESEPGRGTLVRMKKKMRSSSWICEE